MEGRAGKRRFRMRPVADDDRARARERFCRRSPNSPSYAVVAADRMTAVGLCVNQHPNQWVP